MKTLLTTLAFATLMALGGAARADDDGLHHGSHGQHYSHQHSGNPYRYYRSPGYYDPQQRYDGGYRSHYGNAYSGNAYRYPVTPYRSPRTYDYLEHRQYPRGYSSHGYSYDPRYSSPRYRSSFQSSPYYYYRSPTYNSGYSSWGYPYSSYSSPFRGYSTFQSR